MTDCVRGEMVESKELIKTHNDFYLPKTLYDKLKADMKSGKIGIEPTIALEGLTMTKELQERIAKDIAKLIVKGLGRLK